MTVIKVASLSLLGRRRASATFASRNEECASESYFGTLALIHFFTSLEMSCERRRVSLSVFHFVSRSPLSFSRERGQFCSLVTLTVTQRDIQERTSHHMAPVQQFLCAMSLAERCKLYAYNYEQCTEKKAGEECAIFANDGRQVSTPFAFAFALVFLILPRVFLFCSVRPARMTAPRTFSQTI